MTYEDVDVVVRNRYSNVPIGDVVVKVLTKDGRRTVTHATTDSSGTACLLLPAPDSYQLRLFKFGVSFNNPQMLVVGEKVSPSVVHIDGFILKGDESKDSRLCTASGFFRTITGAPKSDLDIIFHSDFNPFVLDGAGVVDSNTYVRTDSSGFASVQLIRHAQYSVVIECWQDHIRHITVPDAPSCNLPCLLFPRVAEVVGLANPIAIRKGKDIEVPVTALLTDGRTPLDLTDIVWTVEDTTVASVISISTNKLTIRGLKRGSTKLQATRNYMLGGEAPVYYPDTPIVGVPVGITVQ